MFFKTVKHYTVHLMKTRKLKNYFLNLEIKKFCIHSFSFFFLPRPSGVPSILRFCACKVRFYSKLLSYRKVVSKQCVSKTKQMEKTDTLAALKCDKLQMWHMVNMHIFAVVFHSPNLEKHDFTEVKSV